ncbi:MAG: FHA domain-containing protein [Bacteroidales bacterium]|nr:FHA domain-containing protein [Bacteroidales bacterium]MBD5282973.1 FHA domain-containing protein [Bacteroides sp.]MDE6427580.1 FHA domain-containing protein [Muribaculaceae bacterium]
MGKIFIVCPECHQQLSFNEVPGYQNMIVECPKCHFKANAGVYRGGAQARGAQGADEVPTQLVMPPKTVADIGQIRVKSTNEVQFLKAGQNVIGRRARTGTADIKISTDMYMSRRHVMIDVVKKSSGYEHHLVEINSTNIVQLNGKPINRGDVLVLKFGDTLTLGKTDIVLETNDDESTRLA